jgi:hypothetical protein
MEAKKKKEERKLQGGDINGKLVGDRELEEKKNLKKENLRNLTRSGAMESNTC